MRFSILLGLAFLAASTDATAFDQNQVATSRRFLASIEPSLAISNTLQGAGIDVNAMTECFKNLNAKGLTMSKKEDRVTITQQCIFSNGGGNTGDNPKGKARDPRAISINDFAKLTKSGQPNANLCDNNTIFKKHDGTQEPDTCVAVHLGELPAVDKCPAQLFIAPNNGATLKANKAIKFKVAISNLDTGFFSDPAIEYYKFPQMLNKKGFIMGHSHITVQEIGDATTPPSAQSFKKFQGLNDPAQGNVFTLDVPEGFPAGNYRACTISGSFAHAPVLCPKAQRGAQEDCIRFQVK